MNRGEVYDIFLKQYPHMDLHGFDRESARVATNDFVYENMLLHKEKMVIIHGIGEGIVKKAVHEALKENKNVLEFHMDPGNSGCTIVTLKKYS